ncbi:beta-lactamase/transpeptidase-like protein [Pholiota conissans]|uniref:Beta-lactamase/transpeptidase-like protein n=1 Tax=Pholiota conissans TaxID=109636 RepID=A0A9P6D4Q2_9AGAR|nr:beta-lactamase/transpeptidase-like protein [Pholiota conissans]
MVTLTARGKQALDDVVATLAMGQTIPGFALGATTSKEEIYFNFGGNKIIDNQSSDAVGPDTVFWICSMTKLVAHIAALQLIDQGKLKEETPVSEFFPQFSNPIILDDVTSPNPSFKPATKVMRVEHLLNFSSGLFYLWTQDIGVSVPAPYAGAHDMKDPHSEFLSILQGNFPGIPLQFEPGTNFAYGYGADILGFIVEKITGITLDQYLQDNVFEPLEMHASFYLSPGLKEKLLPLTLRTQDGKMHLWNEQPGTRIIEQDPSKVSRLMGGIGLYVSLRDYLKLLQHILQILDGTATAPILKCETAEALFIGAQNEDGVKSLGLVTGFAFPGHNCQWSTALAVTMEDWPNRRKKGTGFWAGWAGTHFFIDPTTGIAAVYGTQIMSYIGGNNDIETLKGLTAFEETLYTGLDTGN